MGVKRTYNMVFFCSSLSFGGLEMNIVRMAGWMQERGHQVSLFCVENSSIHSYSVQQGIDKIAFIQRPGKYFALKNGYSISKKLKKAKTEIVLYRDTRDLSALAFAKFFSGNRFRLIYHQAMQFKVSKRDIIHTIRFSFIDTWITPLNVLSEQVKKNTRIPARKIHIIPLGTELDKTLPKKDMTKHEACKLFNLPENACLVGILGRFSPKKGQDFVIECLEELIKADNSIHLVLAGEPTSGREGIEYYDQIQRLISKYHLDNHVSFPGFIRETSAFFKAIDCFVMSSIRETYGMVTVEALVSGVQIIGTNTGGTPELLGYGKYGYLYTPGDKQEFISAIHDIRKNPIPVEKYQKGLQQKFSHTTQCENMELLFSRLCS